MTLSCINEIDLKSPRDQAILDINNVIGRSVDCINSTMGEELSVYYRVGTNIHKSKVEGYYCPYNDCIVFDQFFDIFDDSLSNVLPNNHSSGFVSCDFYFTQQVTEDIVNGNVDSIMSFIDLNLTELVSFGIITQEEYILINEFYNEVFGDIYSIDFCDYITGLENIDISSSTNGDLAKALFLTIPILLDERLDLLNTWYDGTNPEDDQALIGYALLGLARFTAGMFWGVFEKGADDPEAGNCGLKYGLKAAAFGI